MRKSPSILIATLILMLSWTAPAQAIRYGTDDRVHSYVGLIVFYDEALNPVLRCSGTLISPTVVLTAGHCTFGAALAQVWFEPEISEASGYPFTGGILGEPVTHPGFGVTEFPNTSDVGVVLLQQPVTSVGFASLPELGQLDDLATRRGPRYPTFTIVGYGLQQVRPVVVEELVRMSGTVGLINLRSALTDGYNIHLTNSPGRGHGPGGMCFGDSGGPVLLGDVVVGIHSLVFNQNCAGGELAYRVDISETLEFIEQFLD